ncbi:MAG: acetate/propionate family kinase [Malacoplasma sp.]
MANKKYILVLNAGSSSIKFNLYEFDSLISIAQGICERINVDGYFKIEYGSNQYKEEYNFPNHTIAIEFLLTKFKSLKIIEDFTNIILIGHRIVQGLEINESKMIDANVLNTIKEGIKLAPLHNKPEYDVIQIMNQQLPDVVNVAVFDTSFHSDIPKLNSYYAIPKDWVDKFKIKKYGFHGTSYKYILEQFKTITHKNNVNVIICHLGNGASICCVKNDKSFDTSMGLTPNAGLIMGTRCGDIDANIIGYISDQTNMNINEIIKMLNSESGLKGMCGSSDYRDINAKIENGNAYDFANKMFSKKVTNYIVQYINDLENKVDAIIFTGGIGENNHETRKSILENISIKKIVLNDQKNEMKFETSKEITNSDSEIPVYVIRTNEELMIANDAKRIYKDN